MFGHQNQSSSIWGSREIKRYMPRHTVVDEIEGILSHF